ncbi:MAG: OsmC family protein [Pseudomonadota bacterium]
MMGKVHEYTLTLAWTGNTGEGTKTYKSYDRNYTVSADGKPELKGSADPNYLGDPSRWNPEELLVAALSACHKLWFLHLCAMKKIVVTDYVDQPLGTLNAESDGSGEFTATVLRPVITLADAEQAQAADALHHAAHEKCFIARSVNFPVSVDATYR